jgi:hypothetical protein
MLSAAQPIEVACVGGDVPARVSKEYLGSATELEIGVNGGGDIDCASEKGLMLKRAPAYRVTQVVPSYSRIVHLHSASVVTSEGLPGEFAALSERRCARQAIAELKEGVVIQRERPAARRAQRPLAGAAV